MAYVSISKLPTKETAEDSDYVMLDDTKATYKMAIANIISAQNLLKKTDLSSLVKSTTISMSDGSTIEVSIDSLVQQLSSILSQVDWKT